MNKIQEHIAESEKLFDEKFEDYFFRYFSIPEYDNINPEIKKDKQQFFNTLKSFLKQRELALVERIKESFNELTYYRNDEGVKEIEEGVDYVKVDDIKSLLDNKE